MTEQPQQTSTTATDRFAEWEEVSSDQEYAIVERYLEFIADEWGNTYVAVKKAALYSGVPEYVVHAAVQHYTEVVYRGEV